MFRYNIGHLLTANVKLPDGATYDATAVTPTVNAELSCEKTEEELARWVVDAQRAPKQKKRIRCLDTTLDTTQSKC